MHTQKLLSGFGNSRVMYLTYSERGIVTEVSPAIKDFLPDGKHLSIGSYVCDVLQKCQQEELNAVSKHVKESGLPQSFLLQWSHPDGYQVPVAISISYTCEDGFFCAIMPLQEKQRFEENTFRQMEIMRTTLEAMDDFVLVLNREGRFSEIYVDSNNSDLPAFTSGFTKGSSMKDAGFPEETQQLFLEYLEKVRIAGQQEQFQFSIKAFGGELYYQAKISPRYTIMNEFEGATVVVRDITVVKKGEQKLKQSLKYYLKVFDNFPTLIWRANKVGKLDYFNKTWMNFTGRSFEQDMGDGWLQGIHSNDRESTLLAFSKKIGEQSSFALEYRLIHNSGNYRWVKNFCEPLYDYDDKFSGFIGSCFDMNDILSTQKLLVQSELRYRELFDNLQDVVFRVDASGAITRINPAGNQLLGEKNLEGMNLWDFIVPSDKPGVLRVVEDVLSKRKRTFSFETRAICNAGEIKNLQVKAFVKFGEKGKALEIFGIGRDVSKQKRLEKSIMKTAIYTEERERRKFAEELHDGIGPLLSGLKLYLQKDSLEKNLDIRELKILLYCRELVDEAISQARSISNNLTPAVLNDFGLKKALESHAKKINSIGEFTIDIKFNSSIDVLDNDVSLAVFRVVSELINNALKHSGCSKVNISAGIINNVFALSYADNGKGFNLENVRKNSSGKLGLSSMYNRVNSLNGTLVINTSEKNGVFVKIYIPLNVS